MRVHKRGCARGDHVRAAAACVYCRRGAAMADRARERADRRRRRRDRPERRENRGVEAWLTSDRSMESSEGRRGTESTSRKKMSQSLATYDVEEDEPGGGAPDGSSSVSAAGMKRNARGFRSRSQTTFLATTAATLRACTCQPWKLSLLQLWSIEMEREGEEEAGGGWEEGGAARVRGVWWGLKRKRGKGGGEERGGDHGGRVTPPA